MSEEAAPASSAAEPAASWPVKLWSALSMVLIYFGIQGIALLFRITPRFFSPEQLRQHGWIGLYEHHFWQMVLALILIWLYSGGKFSEWGLNFRNAKVSWRIFFWFVLVYSGIIFFMNVLPPLLHREPPTFDYPLTRANIVGWLSFEFIFVGISEEILFRGLIHTYLAKTWTQVWQIGKVAMPTAGIVTTFIFCLAHVDVLHFHIDWLQQLWAFGFGLYYSAAYHRTGSLLNPILAHNYGDGIIFASLYLLSWGMH